MNVNVNIFKNKTNNKLLFMPMDRDKRGVRTNINKPIILEQPYTLQSIGDSLCQCFEVILNKKYTSEDINLNVIRLATGIKSFSKFSKTHDNISVFMLPKEGLEIKVRNHSKSGGYSEDLEVPITKIALNAKREEIGEAILKAFELCR